MEITFTRPVNYSIDLSNKDIADLAEECGLPVRKLKKLVGDGNLLIDHRDAVIEFINNRTENPEIASEDDIQDIEVHS